MIFNTLQHSLGLVPRLSFRMECGMERREAGTVDFTRLGCDVMYCDDRCVGSAEMG